VILQSVRHDFGYLELLELLVQRVGSLDGCAVGYEERAIFARWIGSRVGWLRRKGEAVKSRCRCILRCIFSSMPSPSVAGKTRRDCGVPKRRRNRLEVEGGGRVRRLTLGTIAGSVLLGGSRRWPVPIWILQTEPFPIFHCKLCCYFCLSRENVRHATEYLQDRE
jgi:hypothetical protein